MGDNLAVRKGIEPDVVYGGENDVEYELEAYDGVRLDPVEVAFVDAYCDEGSETRFNATDAYLRARPSTTRVNARVYGSRMSKKPHIMKAIKHRLDTYGLSSQEAMSELRNVALAPFQDLIDVKMRNGEIVSVKMDLASKVRALEIIMRAHNALDNKSAVQNAVVVNINTPGLSEDDLA